MSISSCRARWLPISRSVVTLAKRPKRLLHVTCGNISTADLLALVDEHYAELVVATDAHHYVEVGRAGVIVHDPS